MNTKTLTATVPNMPVAFIENVATAHNFEQVVAERTAENERITAENASLDSQAAAIDANENLSADEKTAAKAALPAKGTLYTIPTKEEYGMEKITEAVRGAVLNLNNRVTEYLANVAAAPEREAGAQAAAFLNQALNVSAE